MRTFLISYSNMQKEARNSAEQLITQLQLRKGDIIKE